MREQRARVADVRGGCFDCKGGDVIWSGKNAMMVAARHHDATGHRTWAEQTIAVRYGPERTAAADQAELFQDLSSRRSADAA